ncbi:MAG: T9SS type A sorting domain-containing protein [Bacteroidia bacterium]
MNKIITKPFFSTILSVCAKVSFITLIILNLLPNQGFSQKPKGLRERWKVNPFDHKIFIENKGQFDANVKNENIKNVLYQADLGGDIKAYFTPNGILYRQVKFIPKYNNGGKNSRYTEHTAIVNKVAVLWEGSNPDVTIEASGKQSYFNSYSAPDNKGTIKADVFTKITYKNLYPGIDVEYVFPGEGKEGIKYTVIVHPGADLSVVKLNYVGAKDLNIDGIGNVRVENEMSNITDHAPVSSYLEGGTADVEYAVNGMEESFSVKNYDKSKTLVIDPWTTTAPGFNIATNSGYDIDYDNAGNVYVAGGYNPFQIAKFNSMGVKQWTYSCFTTDPTAYDLTTWGAFAVDKHSGETYVGEGFNYTDGAWIEKVSASGTKLAYYNGGNNAEFREICRMEYSTASGQILIGGGSTNSSSDNEEVAVVDTTMATLSPKNPLNITGPGHDVTLMAIDPTGSPCYMAFNQSSWVSPPTGNENIDNNVVCSVPAPALTSLAMSPVSDGYDFQDYSSVKYVGDGAGDANGMNGMAASPNWLYMFDGATLQQRNKTTGALNKSKTGLGTSYTHGGLVADACDNVFVGHADSVVVYNSSLTWISATKVADTVFAIALDTSKASLYVCGKGFVEELSNPIANGVATATPTNAICGSNNGSVTAQLIICNGSIPSPTYLWSPGGQTTQTISNLAAGTYSVTITNGDSVYHATATVGTSPITVTATTSTPNICPGGSAILAGGGATSYTWNTGQTTDSLTVSPTVTTTYTVTGKDADGCSASGTVTVNVGKLTVTNSSPTTCVGDSSILSASGGVSYLWNTGATAASITVKPTITTTYKVVATMTGGCKDSTTETVTINTPTITVTPASPGICSGDTATLTASGGTTYAWNTGKTNDTIIVHPTVTTSYTVTGKNLTGCSANAVVTLTVGTLTVTATASLPVTCSGSATTLTANGATKFTWNTGSTNAAISVSPTATTTYSVTGTSGTGCTGNATVTVTVNPLPAVSITGNGSICAGSIDLLTANAPTAISYNWSDGGTNDTAQVKSSNTYTLTVKDGNGCVNSASKSVTVNALPGIKIGNSSSACSGIKDTLRAIDTAGDASPLTYNWSTGGKKDTIIIANPTSSQTYSITVTDANGCINNATQAVTVNPNPVASITGGSSNLCSGSVLTAKETGTGSDALSYQWSGGSTGTKDTAIVLSATTYNVLITDAVTGCKSNLASETITSVTPAPTVSIYTYKSSICEGKVDTLKAIDTTGDASPLSYTWSEGGTNTILGSNTIYGALTSSGTFTITLTVEDANGCKDKVKQIVTVNALPAVSIAGNVSGGNSICSGEIDTLKAEVSGVNPFSYSWSQGAITDTVLAGIGGVYTVKVSDANGCIGKSSATVTVNLPPNIDITSTAATLCKGSMDTLEAIDTLGDASPLYYSWSTGSTKNEISGTFSTSKTYSLTVIDAKGCRNLATDSVIVSPLPSVTIYANDTILCAGTVDTLKAADTAGDAGPLTYNWSTGVTSNAIYGAFSTSGSYKVTVTDTNGCMNSAMQEVTVDSVPVVKIMGADSIAPGNFDTLVASGACNYLWSEGQTTGTIIVAPTTMTTYSVTGSCSGCSSIDTFTVKMGIFTGIKSVPASSQITIYPDPATNTLTLQISGGQQLPANSQIEIIDVSGKEVYSSQLTIDNSQLTMDVSGLAQGMYFIKVITPASTQVLKFVKM